MITVGLRNGPVDAGTRSLLISVGPDSERAECSGPNELYGILADLGGAGEMEIEVRHARAVATLVQAGSISKAASLLDLPQPSLSALLTRIEKTVGGEVFE